MDSPPRVAQIVQQGTGTIKVRGAALHSNTVRSGRGMPPYPATS